MYQFFSQYKYLCTFQRHIWITWIKHCLATINEVMFLQCFEHVKWWEFPSVSWMLLSLLYKNQECTELLWIPPNYRGLCELKRISHDKLTDILSSNRVVLLSPENGIKCNFFWPSCLFKHICQSLPQNDYSSLKKSFRVRKSFGWLRSNCSPFPFLPFKSRKSVKVWAEFLRPAGV